MLLNEMDNRKSLSTKLKFLAKKELNYFFAILNYYFAILELNYKMGTELLTFRLAIQQLNHYTNRSQPLIIPKLIIPG